MVDGFSVLFTSEKNTSGKIELQVTTCKTHTTRTETAFKSKVIRHGLAHSVMPATSRKFKKLSTQAALPSLLEVYSLIIYSCTY